MNQIWVVFKILLKFKIFEHPGSAKHKNWENEETWVTLKNFAQIEDFLPPRPCKRRNFDKSIKFESRLKFCSNLRFLITLVLQDIKFGKIKKFESRLCSNWRFLTTPALQKAKFGWINQIWVALKILLEFNLGKWRNLSHVENFAQIEDFWPHRPCKRRNLDESIKFESHWKFCSNLIWENEEIWVTLKILLKFKIFEHSGPAKRKIWENEEIWVALKIVLKFKIFDHPGPKGKIWINQSNLSCVEQCAQISGFFYHPLSLKSEIWQNQEIWVVLKVMLLWTTLVLQKVLYVKIKKFESRWKLCSNWSFETLKTWILAKSRNLSRIEKCAQI